MSVNWHGREAIFGDAETENWISIGFSLQQQGLKNSVTMYEWNSISDTVLAVLIYFDNFSVLYFKMYK